MNDKVNTISITELKKPQLQLNFTPQDNGTFNVSIVDTGLGGNDRLPMLIALMKNKEALAGIVKNELVADGSPGRFSTIGVNLMGERGGSSNHGGEIGGDGKVKNVVDVSAGLNGESATNGKINGGIQFTYTPGSAGLSRERQGELKEILNDHVDKFCLDWATSHYKGANNIELDKSTKLKVTSEAATNYVADELGMPRMPKINSADLNGSLEETGKWIQDTLRKAGKVSVNDDSPAAPDRLASGLDAPSHPYHRMYTDLAGKLGEMTPQQRSGQAPDTLAAALTLSAADAKFDPAKPVEIIPGKFENSLFAVQGDPSSPASKSAMIDTANPKMPTAEQVAQLQSANGQEQPQIAIERSGPARA